MSKAGRIFLELKRGLAHTASAVLNTLVFDGDMYTSTSARAHMETHDERGRFDELSPAQWINRRKFINKLFYKEKDHCKNAWEKDRERAIKKIRAVSRRNS